MHYDALYQAYLNACLILLGFNTPFDPGLPFQHEDYQDKQTGFAHFGPPHILTLITEVATRALKAVRFQKYNVRRRLRPEAVGAECIGAAMDALPSCSGWLHCRRWRRLSAAARASALGWIPPNGARNWLLPMAFTEGAPVHPAYGAGHATVAGACITILRD